MAAPLTIALCMWNGWRPVYNIAHVNALARMLREHLRMPFRIVLLTDQDSRGAEVDEVHALPGDPSGAQVPGQINCYRRLRLFDSSYSSQFGTEWVMSIDLDTLILDDITEQIQWGMNDFGFCIIRGRLAERNGQRPYNGSLYLIKVGAHQHVWDSFDWIEGPRECVAAGWRGSDQVWLSLKLRGAPTLGPEHGVYFFQQYLDSSDSDPAPRMLHYAGLMKPWSRMAQHATPELYAEYLRHTN